MGQCLAVFSGGVNRHLARHAVQLVTTLTRLCVSDLFARMMQPDDDDSDVPAPSLAALREVAFSYLSKRSASEAQVRTALERKISTWTLRAMRAGQDEGTVAELAETARAAATTVLAELASSRLVDDAKFAVTRARRLTENGKSRRAILMHLAAKGVSLDAAREAAPADADVELDAALRLARKRHIGPFLRDDAVLTRDARQKALGTLARAGFDRSVCERVIDMPREDAEARTGARGSW